MRLRPRIVLALVLAAVPGAAQDPGPPARESVPMAVPADPAYEALVLKYGAAIREYGELLIKRARQHSTTPEPPHPARRFLAEFQALAAKDSGGAQGWILANLAFVVDEPAERRALALEWFPRLLAGHVDEEAAIDAIQGLRTSRADIGDEEVFSMATKIAEASRVDEIRGQAKLLQVWARTEGESTKDPKRWEEANEIYRELLFTLPKTSAGRNAAGTLYGPVQEDFYARERRWVDELLELQAQGKPPDAWPRQPMHEVNGDFQLLANAGHTPAVVFVDRLYPEYSMVERQGPGLAYSWLVNELGEHYSDGLGGPWNALRTDLLIVIHRQFPNDRWVLDSLRRLLPQVALLPSDRVELAMQPLLEKSEDPRVRAAALHASGLSVRSGGDQKSYERAIAYFTRVRDEYPKDELRPAAESARAELARVMPGQPALAIDLADPDGRPIALPEYRGRAVMLEFWSFHWPPFLDGIPARQELLRRLEGRPFALLGVNLDHRKPAELRDLAAKHGVGWRCASTYSTNALLAEWAVRCQPTTILLDAEGIIRARDLPWTEMTALAEKLVAEAERSPPGSSGAPK